MFVDYNFDEQKGKNISLGHVGDFGFMSILFDCTEFFNDIDDEKENKTANVAVNFPDGSYAELPLEVVGNVVTWEIDDVVTETEGFGEFQLKVSDGTMQKCYPVCGYCVEKSITEPVTESVTEPTGE